MIDATNIIRASLEVGREFLRPPNESDDTAEKVRTIPLQVPIRTLGVDHRARIARHLLSLEPNDRYLRFGYMAQDEQIQRYVDGLDFDRDEIFGIYNRKLELIAMAHLAYASPAGHARNQRRREPLVHPRPQ